MSRKHEDLVVWQKAISLCTSIYALTDHFPKSEVYGLTGQMRRCAVSIASNIAEGTSRYSNKEFGQFLAIAKGSSAELHTQLVIAKEIGYIDSSTFTEMETMVHEIAKMLNGLQASLKRQIPPQHQRLETTN